MKINLKRINQAFHYEAINNENLKVDIDANPIIGGEGKGVRPMELVLMGLASCTSIDVGLILKKQKQEVIDYQVEATAERKEDEGKPFKSINLHFIINGNIKEDKLKRAIELTLSKYCSVALSLNKEIDITYTYQLS